MRILGTLLAPLVAGAPRPQGSLRELMTPLSRHTVNSRTRDRTSKISLTPFPNVWSASVIVATSALAGYSSPQDSSNELPFRQAILRGQPTTVPVPDWPRPHAGQHQGLQCGQALEAAKVALLELPATVGFWESAYQSSS